MWSRRISNAIRDWPYGVRCARCNAVLVGHGAARPVYQRFSLWLTLRALSPVFEIVCGDCR